MRRRHDDTRVSLFSFQDIITSLAGLMIFIALMLVLGLGTSASPAAMTRRRPSADQVQRQIVQQTQALENLNSRDQQLTAETAALASRDTGSLQRDIAALQQQLARLQSTHANGTTRTADLADEVAQATARQSQTTREIARLAFQKTRLQATPKRVVYTLTPDVDDHKSVVLIEISRSTALIGVIGQDHPLLRIESPVPDVRWEKIKGALTAYPPSRYDVLVLLKPSAFADGDYRARIGALGYRIGSEPLEEDRTTMRP